MELYDLHTHTTYSDGDASLEFLIKKAKEKGYKLGVSDHIFCCGMETVSQIEYYLDRLEQYDVFRGVEANMGEDFSLPDRLASKLNYVIASVHGVPDGEGGIIRLSEYFGYKSKHRESYEKNYKEDHAELYMTLILQMVEKTLQRERVDIYGHSNILPFYDALEGTSFLEDWENELLDLYKKYHVAFEISGLWKYTPESMVTKAIERDLKFSFGSDCHLLEEVCDLNYVEGIIKKFKIKEQQFYIPHK